MKKPKKFRPSIVIDKTTGTMKIYLEDCSTINEWIKGEGGDVSIARSDLNGRVVGVTLPFKGSLDDLKIIEI